MQDNPTPQADTLDPKGLSRASKILPLLPFKKSSLFRLSKTGHFPKAIKLTSGIVCWRNDQVLEWLANQSADSSEVSQ
jgi:predicted DNA-binding transcriptional regulator AlpA